MWRARASTIDGECLRAAAGTGNLNCPADARARQGEQWRAHYARAQAELARDERLVPAGRGMAAASRHIRGSRCPPPARRGWRARSLCLTRRSSSFRVLTTASGSISRCRKHSSSPSKTGTRAPWPPMPIFTVPAAFDLPLPPLPPLPTLPSHHSPPLPASPHLSPPPCPIDTPPLAHHCTPPRAPRRPFLARLRHMGRACAARRTHKNA